MKKVCVAVLGLMFVNAYSASFPCESARTESEKTVCASADLSKLDVELAKAYREALSKTREPRDKLALQKEQREWPAMRDARCYTDETCLAGEYEDRINVLRALLPGSGNARTTARLNHTISPLAPSDSLTGSWTWRGLNEASGYLQTIQSSERVQFQLELQRGAPSYNSGFMEGEFTLRGKKGVFQTKEYGNCEIKFVFKKSQVVLDQGSPTGCGFGYGVIADGTYYLQSNDKPAFSVGDPQITRPNK